MACAGAHAPDFDVRYGRAMSDIDAAAARIPITPCAFAQAGRGVGGHRPQAPRAGRRFVLGAMLIALSALVGCGAETSGSARIAQDLGCMKCHGMVTPYVGPGFAQIAARYRDDDSAAARLAQVIRQGSVGTWGRVIMPRQPQVSDADAGLLAAWILSQPPAKH